MTFFGWFYQDLIEGLQAQITNADNSRTFVATHMHNDRLYVLEGTVPARAPQPGLFQQSMQFLDAEGRTIRYETVYSNRYPEAAARRAWPRAAGGAITRRTSLPLLSPAALRKQLAAGETAPLYMLVGDDELEKAAVAAEFADMIDEGLRVPSTSIGSTAARSRLTISSTRRRRCR